MARLQWGAGGSGGGGFCPEGPGGFLLRRVIIGRDVDYVESRVLSTEQGFPAIGVSPIFLVYKVRLDQSR